MPEYLSPGVYIEEIDTRPSPIEGVGTSTAGFVGLAMRGPTGPRLITSWLDFQRWYGGLADPDTLSYLPFAAKGFFDNGGRRAYIARVHRSDAVPSTITLPTEARTLVLTAGGAGRLDGRLFAWVGPATSTAPDRFRLILLYYRDLPRALPLVDPLNPANAANPDRVEPDLVEDFDELEVDADLATGSVGRSTLVTGVFSPPAMPIATGTDGSGNRTYVAAAGGSDGVAALTLDDFMGMAPTPTSVGTGLSGLAAIDEISLLSVPDEGHAGIAATVRIGIRDAVVAQCEQMNDRFGILQLALDAGNGIPENVTAPVDTSYAAVYYPWVRVPDPLTGETYLVPPGGHIAGVYARTDVERGVHKAPANEIVRGIIDDLPSGLGPLAVTVTRAQHDILNSRGVNVIRDFRAQHRGIRVWGARTLSTDAEWKYVTVRRLLIFLEASIEEGTRWAVFEPNDEPLWARIRNEIHNFLTTVWRTGALMGTKSEEAFFVKCDQTTVTQDDLDHGRLVGIVGVAAIKPTEFVIFRFSQKTLGAPG